MHETAARPTSELELGDIGRRKNPTRGLMTHAVLVIGSLITLYPLLWMLSASFKPQNEMFANDSLIPSHVTFDGHTSGWHGLSVGFDTFFMNSLVISALSILGNLIACSLTAFAFARLQFVGRRVLFGIMLLTMMLPYQVVMIPQFILFFKIHWVNTFAPLIVPNFLGHAFFIFLMMQFIRGLPIELDESAKIDGCGRFRTFTHIIFPLITPAIITTIIFQFYWKWDDFLGPLLYLNRPVKYTVSLALRMFADPMTTTDWSALFAMGSLSLLPILVIFLFFQKYLVEGISTSGLKA